MEERTKQWLIRGLIVVVVLATSWGWSRFEMSNMAYMQFVVEKNQQNLSRQQQLEANELELKRTRGQCCDCSLILEEEPNEEPGVEEEGGQNP